VSEQLKNFAVSHAGSQASGFHPVRYISAATGPSARRSKSSRHSKQISIIGCLDVITPFHSTARVIDGFEHVNRPDLADHIAKFQFRDIRPKAASEFVDIADASKLLGHSKEEITRRVYRRVGAIAKPSE